MEPWVPWLWYWLTFYAPYSIPASIITLGAGTIFGLKTGSSWLLSARSRGVCSFLLARTFLREKVAHWAQANARFRFLDEAIGRQGFKMVLLTRLSPIFPFILLNYFLGLTAVRTGAYVLANYWACCRLLFFCLYRCSGARRYWRPTEASAGLYQQILKYVGLMATIAVVVMVTRMARAGHCAKLEVRKARRSQESRPRSQL